jgi:hypothetical protein
MPPLLQQQLVCQLQRPNQNLLRPSRVWQPDLHKVLLNVHMQVVSCYLRMGAHEQQLHGSCFIKPPLNEVLGRPSTLRPQPSYARQQDCRQQQSQLLLKLPALQVCNHLLLSSWRAKHFIEDVTTASAR